MVKSVAEVIERLQYKANNIKAKLEPSYFSECADYLINISNCNLNSPCECEKDNFCEWRLCDEETNVYDTDCRNPHILIDGTPKDNNYNFCPYCGRKITI